MKKSSQKLIYGRYHNIIENHDFVYFGHAVYIAAL